MQFGFIAKRETPEQPRTLYTESGHGPMTAARKCESRHRSSQS